MIHITDTTVFDDKELAERFVRSTGARGQNVRKHATAVELRLDLKKSSLPTDVKRRVIGLAGRHVTTDRVLVIVSRADRSQQKNRESARARLLLLLKRASMTPAPRVPTRISRAVLKHRAILKHHHSAIKRARRVRDVD